MIINFDEKIINESEKLPIKINKYLDKGKSLENQWNNNDCVNIEDSIKTINIIKEKFEKTKKLNGEIFFDQEDEVVNDFLEKIKKFGKLKTKNNFHFSFKNCPENIKDGRKYIVSGEKRNIITKTGKDGECMGTICENQLDNNKEEHTWIIKILKTKKFFIDIGVAPYDFDICSSKYNNYGWYLYCAYLTLDSGPPHNYSGKKTNLNKIKNEVKVIMNMNKRTLKFIIDNEDKGVQFENIPIDKPLVPAVCLETQNDSIKIINC